MEPPAGDADTSDELLCGDVIRDAGVAAAVVDPETNVALVLRARRVPQVRQAVVEPLSIRVVDLTLWPHAEVDRPCHPVLFVFAALDRDVAIAAGMQPADAALA